MSYKDSLIKLKEFITKLDSDDKVNKLLDEDLKKHTKEELYKIYGRDYTGFGIMTTLFDSLTLSDELLYISLSLNKISNNAPVEPAFTALMFGVVIASLSFRTYSNNEKEKAFDKIHVLSLRKDNEKE